MDDLIFKSIDKETPYTELPVQGSIPLWLKGSLFRNGPAKFELGEIKLNHWFDGFSILHKFDIDNGKVSYKSKFLQSEDYLNNIKAGKIKSRHFGTVADPCASIFNKFFSAFKRPNPDNTNVSAVKIGNKIVAVSDFSTMMEFDYNSLETKGRIDFRDEFGNAYLFSASHSSFDPDTGEFFNCVGDPGPKGKLHFFKLQDDTFQRNFIGSTTIPKHTYYHSFALTKKYFIFIEQPLELNLLHLIFSRSLNIPYEGSYKWHPEHGTKFHLLDRTTGEIKTYQSESFFFFHTVNAFDQNNEVIIDLCHYEDSHIIKSFYIEALKKNGIPHKDMARLARITINQNTEEVAIRFLSEERFDLPTFNFSKACKPYKYIYGLGFKQSDKIDINNQLVKIDIDTGAALTWHENGKYPSEPLFVQYPQSEQEDGGIILSVVLDTAKENSFLLVLDAKNFKELARAEAPTYLPIGLHGMFYPEK